MRILSRYVLREFLVPLVYCLTGFLSIYVLFDFFGSFSRMTQSKIPLLTAISYFSGYLAPYFHYIAPAALMLATLYTMWSFCRHSEIVAMRASGVSFMAIVKPLLAVSVLMSGLVVYVNEVYVPRHSHWAEQIKRARFETSALTKGDNVVFRNAGGCRTWDVDEIEDFEGRHMRRVRVTVDRPDGGARLYSIEAAKADYLDGEWWFTEPRVQHYDANGQEVASAVPELDALTYRCFDGFDETPSDFIMQNRPWKYNSILDRVRYLKTHKELTDAARRDYSYDIWAQIMSPLACIIITLFAIPAGIASGRQSVFKGILSALLMYFSFYGVAIVAMVLAKNGLCPPVVAALSPAALFLSLGIRGFVRQR